MREEKRTQLMTTEPAWRGWRMEVVVEEGDLTTAKAIQSLGMDI